MLQDYTVCNIIFYSILDRDVSNEQNFVCLYNDNDIEMKAKALLTS